MRSRKINRIPLQPTEVSVVLQKMAVDLCGPLPETERGNKYIANFVDMFSKFVISIPIPDTKACSVATTFLKEVIYKYGTPMELISDNASNFSAENIREMCLNLQVKKIFVTPYHSASNGGVERTFRTWQDRIAKMPGDKNRNWDLLVPAATYCYNTAVHSSTKYTPFYLMYGRESRLSVEQLYYPWREAHGSHVDYYDEQKSYREIELERLATAWEQCQENLEKNNDQMKKCFDRKAKEPEFVIGEKVLLKKFTHAVGSAQKFANFWEGIHTIVGLPDSHHALVVRNGLPQSAARKVHLDQIKTFKERQQPEQETIGQTLAMPTTIATPRTRSQETLQRNTTESPERGRSYSSESEDKTPNTKPKPLLPKEQKSFTKTNSEPITTRYGRTVKSPKRYDE